MPTYQYRCKSCSYEFEELQRISEDALVTCPNCHKDTLVRVIGGAGLVFKGSGFYLTDYARKKSGGDDKSAASPKESNPASSKESAGSKEAGGPKDSGGPGESGGSKDSGGSKGSGGPKSPGGPKDSGSSSGDK